MDNKLALEYRKVNTAYNEWIQKTHRAHETVRSHQIDTDALEEKQGIAKIQLDQIALACINNKNNIAKAAHTINTIVFDIRQTAKAYTYDPYFDEESYTFQDGTVLNHMQNQWY